MLNAILCIVAGATSFAAGFAIARLGARAPASSRDSMLALESIARTLAADVRGHSGTVRSAEAELSTASAESVRACIRQILEAGSALQARLQEAENRLAQQTAVLERTTKASQIDALTQIYNRGALDERLRAAYDRQTESGRVSSLLMVDIDHFKRVNDGFGHLAGDVVLKAVAKRILEAVPAGTFVARYGGEEFATLCEGSTAMECREIAEAIRSAIGRGEVSAGAKAIKISSSAGLADTSEAKSVEEWIEFADAGLYQAKRAGRDQGFVRLEGELTPLIPPPLEAGPDASSRDSITGLLVSGAFASLLDRAVEAETEGVILVVRLEGYDDLIERRGFRAAEGALKSVAAAIRATARASDPAARINKATFALMLAGAERPHADRLCERVHSAFESATSGDDGLSLKTGYLALSEGTGGKNLIARCISLTTDAWFPTSV